MSADIEAFHEEGWYIVPDLFSPAECDEIVAHVEQAVFELALGEADDGPLSYRPMMHLVSPELTAVATDARWASIVMPLLGTGDARLYWEQAVAKPPQARTELPWHQDNGYTPLVPEEYVTCWLALDDATIDNGCLWVIPGSHHQGTVRHRNSEGPFRVGHDGDPSEGIPVPVGRGSVLVFSSLMMHRSGPNITDRDRRAWIIQFCGAEARSALSGRVLDDR
ncbi:MAG TPA: phytanoyl-CoA dioxygenase family protein, partial [Microthrixaceae bacterium]|nr:phytanoyl-CoA dioxygenase family protein [Microthrixaceae bacterium]